MFKSFFLLFFSFYPVTDKPATLDKHTTSDIKLYMDKVYNYEFDVADSLYHTFKNKVQDHPVGPFLLSQHLYWKEFPMERFPSKVDLYQKYLLQTLNLSEAFLKKEAENPEGIFFAIASHGALAGIYLNKNNYLKTANEAQKTYGLMKTAFSLLQKHHQFLLPCGAYNYFREVYPEIHPFYKPFVFFFRSGDKAKGLKELAMAVEENYLIDIEALQYLSHIYLHYENNYEKALIYSGKLNADFPANPYFTSIHIETLLEKKEYIAASDLLSKIEKTGNPYFDGIYNVFAGLLEEHHFRNFKKAGYFYEKAIVTLNTLDRQAYHYKSIAYYGLGSIAYREEKFKEAEKYYENFKNFSIYNTKLKPYDKNDKK